MATAGWTPENMPASSRRLCHDPPDPSPRDRRDHGHDPAPATSGARAALSWALVITLGMAAIEAFAGWRDTPAPRRAASRSSSAREAGRLAPIA